MTWQKIEYYVQHDGSIVLPSLGPPFDGKPVLIKTAIGVVEAWWWQGEWSEDTPISPAEFSGFCWVCYDDAFQEELDGALGWMPIP